MAKAPPRGKAQAPDSGDALAFTGEEALARLSDFARRIIAVPKAELPKAKPKKRKRRAH